MLFYTRGMVFAEINKSDLYQQIVPNFEYYKNLISQGIVKSLVV